MATKQFIAGVAAIVGFGLGMLTERALESPVTIDAEAFPLATTRAATEGSQPIGFQCPEIHLAIAVFGQSNSTNRVNEFLGDKFTEKLLQFDWRSGKCHAYSEPLLGTDGTGGNPISSAVQQLASEVDIPLIVIPFGVGSSSVFDWAFGDLSYLHKQVMASMALANISSPVFLWHQGEKDSRKKGQSIDAFLNSPQFVRLPKLRLGTRKNDYAAALQVIIARTRVTYTDSRFGIAIATKCTERESWKPVADAQREVAASSEFNFVSAESDEIPTDTYWRFDGCHFSLAGAKKLSAMYLSSLRQVLRTIGHARVENFR